MAELILSLLISVGIGNVNPDILKGVECDLLSKGYVVELTQPGNQNASGCRPLRVGNKQSEKAVLNAFERVSRILTDYSETDRAILTDYSETDRAILTDYSETD